MAKSLKQKNQPQLITFVLVNASTLAVVLLGLKHVHTIIENVHKVDLELFGKIVALPAALALVIGIVGWAFPKRWKEMIIFWTFDKNCLPSSRAFSVIAQQDPRIHIDRLKGRCGEFPVSPREQTSAWYAIYKKHSEDVSIQDAHCAYLRYREMTGLIPAIAASFVLCSIFLHPPLRSIALGSGLILIEYFFLAAAARNAATHFVSNVLAIESTME
jgi:hypothetical protein